MDQTSEDNDKKFNVILRTLDLSDHIGDKLHEIDQTICHVNDSWLADLLDSANDVNSILQNDGLRNDNYNRLIEQSNSLEAITKLIVKLDDSINDPSRYEEAIISLESIEQLYSAHGRHIPLIENLHKQVLCKRSYLVSNICDRLEDLKESSDDGLSSTISMLMRCGNFTDRELRLKYLQARDNWFNNSCEAKSDSFESVISVFCHGIPLIFEEYKKIFGNSGFFNSKNLTPHSATDNAKEDGAIINSWLLLKTTTFVSSLDSYLIAFNQSKTLTPTLISDTMQKCFKLTDSLATIGFDFSSRLKPLFYKTLIEQIKYNIERTTERFESDFAKAISKSVESLLLPVDDEILRISNMRPEEQLPKSIEHYPIFKIYCLYIIESLRWVQTTKNILSPISLCLDTYAALNWSLTRVVQALAVVLNTDNNSSHPISSKIAISFLTEVLPFVTTYCEMLFPEKLVLNAIGLSKSEYKTIVANSPDKLRNFRLDLKKIADPLRNTMPALMQAVEG